MSEVERLRLEVNRLTRENERLHGEAALKEMQLKYYRERDDILTKGNNNLHNLIDEMRKNKDSHTSLSDDICN